MKIHRAGFIPYFIKDSGDILYLCIEPSLSKIPNINSIDPEMAMYQMCKGKIREGEDTKEAAIREAVEETGMFIGNVKTDTIENLGVFLTRTTVYCGEIADMEMFSEPDQDEIISTRWLSINDVMEIGRPLHHHIFKKAETEINRRVTL